MKKPVIELKNLKVAEFASEETTCYEATVYVDGKRFCIASNQGHGGESSHDPIRPRGGYKSGEEAGAARRELDADVHKIALRFNPNAVKSYDDVPKDREPFKLDDYDRHMAEEVVTTWNVFEYLVDEALTIALYSKDMKAAMSKKWIFLKTTGGDLYECKRAKGQNAETMLEVLRKVNPEAVLLNALPTAEALTVWRANG